MGLEIRILIAMEASTSSKSDPTSEESKPDEANIDLEDKKNESNSEDQSSEKEKRQVVEEKLIKEEKSSLKDGTSDISEGEIADSEENLDLETISSPEGKNEGEVNVKTENKSASELESFSSDDSSRFQELFKSIMSDPKMSKMIREEYERNKARKESPLYLTPNDMKFDDLREVLHKKRLTNTSLKNYILLEKNKNLEASGSKEDFKLEKSPVVKKKTAKDSGSEKGDDVDDVDKDDAAREEEKEKSKSISKERDSTNTTKKERTRQYRKRSRDSSDERETSRERRDRSRERRSRERSFDKDRRRRYRSNSRDRYKRRGRRRGRSPSPFSPKKSRRRSSRDRGRDRRDRSSSPPRRNRQSARSPSPKRSRESNRYVKKMSLSSLKITINRERSDSWEEEIVGYEDSKKLVNKNQKQKDVEEISLSSSESERKSTSKERKKDKSGTPSLTPSPEWKRKKRRPYSPEPSHNKRRRSKSKSPEKKPKRLPFIFEMAKKLQEEESKKKQYDLKPIREAPLGAPQSDKFYQQRLQENMRLQQLRREQMEQQKQEEQFQHQPQHQSPSQRPEEGFLQQPGYQQVPTQPYAQPQPEQYQSVPQQQPEPAYQQIPQQQPDPSYQPLPQQQQEPLLQHPLQQPQPQPQHLFHQQPPPQPQFAHWPPQPQVLNPVPYQQMHPHYDGHLYQGMEIPQHAPPVQIYPSMTYTFPNSNFPYGVPPGAAFPPPTHTQTQPQPQPQPQPQFVQQPEHRPSPQPPPSHMHPTPPPSHPQPAPAPPQPPPAQPPPSSQTPQRQPTLAARKHYEEIVISPESPDIEILPPPLMTFKPPSSPDNDDTTVPFNESPKETFETPAEEPPASSATPSSIHFEDFNPEPEFETELFLSSEQIKNIPPMELSTKDTEEVECHKKLLQIINDGTISESLKNEALEQYKKAIEKKTAEKRKLDEIKMTLGVSKSRSGVKTSTPCRPPKKSTNVDSNAGDNQPSGSKSSLDVSEDTPSESSELKNALVKRIQDAVKNLEKDPSTAPVLGRFILYPLDNLYNTQSSSEDLSHQSPLLKGRGRIRITDPDQEPEDNSPLVEERGEFSFYCDDDPDSPEPADIGELISTVIKKVNNNNEPSKPSDGSRPPFTFESAVQCDLLGEDENKLKAENRELRKEFDKLSNQNANLKNYADYAKNLKKCYEGKKQEIINLTNLGAEKDEEIKSLKEQLLKGDKATGRTQIAQAEINSLCHRLKQKDREINALKKAVGELSNENEVLKKEAKNKNPTSKSILKNDTIMVHRCTQTAVTDITPIRARKSVATQASVDKRARNTQTDESSFATSQDSSTGDSSPACSSKDSVKAKNDEVRQKHTVNNTGGRSSRGRKR